MLEAVKTAPNQPDWPYRLESLGGEVIYIPLSKSATRLLVTGKESENAFAVIGTGGTTGDPIGFHFHREAHDVFLCLKGQVNVWSGDQCRTMDPGDFASVPPGTVHQYQIIGHQTEFVGLIVPGGWEEFFRFIGEPYNGPMFPLDDKRNFFEVLLPKLKAASEIFDMVPVRDQPNVQPQPWCLERDSTLPGDLRPYFLRAGCAPRYILGSVVVNILASPIESAGRFSIGSIEGSSWHQNNPLAKSFMFENVHHAFMVTEGTMNFTVGSENAILNTGEVVYVPRKQRFSIVMHSRYAKAYVFSSGQGILSVLSKAGQRYNQHIIPEKAEEWRLKDLSLLESEMHFNVR